MRIESRMTSKGQTTIPAEIRERLGLQTGDRIAFIEMEHGFLILPRNRPASTLFGALSQFALPDTSLEDYDRAIGEGISEQVESAALEEWTPG
jgi:AbrB family looped-hinge helix DNA binding protein